MKLLIVEDEPMVARRVERLVREILGAKLAKVHTLPSLPAALAYLDEHPIDLLLLDLNLRGQDGFDLLETAVAGAFHTVIISANTEHALRAFEYGVLDFVAKPFTRDRLAQALERVTGQHARQGATRFLTVREGNQVRPIAVEAIRYAEGAGPYSELHLADGQTALHSKNLDQLATLLPPDFLRIHKSYLVCLTHVANLQAEAGSRYHVHLTDGDILPVGRTRVKTLRERLGG